MILRQNKYIKIFTIENGAIIYNKQTRKSCTLGEAEYKIYSLLNGINKLEDISVQCQIDEETLNGLMQVFDKYELLECNEKKETHKKGFFDKRVLAYGIKYSGIVSNQIFQKILNMLFLLSFPFLIVCILGMNGKVDVDAMIDSVNIVHLLIMDVFLAVSISVHELSHAVFAHINGAFCAEIGYQFDFLCPAAYTTLCGVERIQSKYKRSQIFLSGMASNAIIAGISLLAMGIPGLHNNTFLFMVFASNLCLIIINCITAASTDLYLLFTVLFGDPNLKQNSLRSIRDKTILNKLSNIIYLLLTFVLEPAIIIGLLIIALMKI